MYILLPTVILALKKMQIHNTEEHRVTTVMNTLFNNYFPHTRFAITHEQPQGASRLKPDCVIQYINNDNWVHHVFAEDKHYYSPMNILPIVDQLLGAVQETLPHPPASYLIIVKGPMIAFYQYFSNTALLDAGLIAHYKGLIPMNYIFTLAEFLHINPYSIPADYIHWSSSLPDCFVEYNGLADVQVLTANGELWFGLDSSYFENYGHYPNTFKIPHVFDLLKHPEYVHALFKYAASNKAGFQGDLL